MKGIKFAKRAREDFAIYCHKHDETRDDFIGCTGCKLRFCLEYAEISATVFDCIDASREKIDWLQSPVTKYLFL